MTRQFDPTVPIEAARTPPSEWYCDGSIDQRERQTIFRDEWQFVGRVSQVQAPGAYFSGRLHGETYFVARGEDGRLRAFFNVCRHHAAEIVTGEGAADTFVCPYHGWSYRLDGAL